METAATGIILSITVTLTLVGGQSSSYWNTYSSYGPYTTSAPSCKSHSNGCSIPFHLPFFFKKKFTPSCDKHDVCYACAHHFGRQKLDCDRMLYSEANKVCNSFRKRFIATTLTAAEKEFCKGVSLGYYEAVHHFGNSHFPSSSPSWCSQSWVRHCML